MLERTVFSVCRNEISVYYLFELKISSYLMENTYLHHNETAPVMESLYDFRLS